MVVREATRRRELGPRPPRAVSLLALVDSGTIRVIDILILIKHEDGSVEAMELSDIEDLGPLQAVEAEVAELLAADGVTPGRAGRRRI